MIDVLSKPAEQITAGDIESLIESEVPEGEQIEFKESLPANNKNGDPWMSGEGPVGEKAKNELLKETVAFANAYGGVLLLGVRESKAKPPVAAEINPIPRCTDLAENLKDVFRNRVEPPLPRLEIFGVPTEGDRGAVVFRVGRSRLAPHRVTKMLVCPVRRSDRCESMSMREIQDMTLNVSRGLERLDRRLSERSERFSREFGRLLLMAPETAFGIRLTSAPVGDEIQFDRVFRRPQLIEGLEEQWRTVWQGEGENRRSLASPIQLGTPWRPMLRAARTETPYSPTSSNVNYNGNSYREIHCDGLIELGLVTGLWDTRESSDLYFNLDYPFVLFANLVIQAHRIRNQAGSPGAEYAVEVETNVRGRAPMPTLPPELYLPQEITGVGGAKFPRYSLGDRDEIPRLLNLFRRDFWNHMGTDIGAGAGELAIDDWPSED